MGQFRKFKLATHADDRFSLTPLEVKEQLDFIIKRVYAITQGKKPTGSHCHKVERECFICFQGGVTAAIDDGSGLKDVPLQAGEAIYVGPYVWHHFKDWAPNTVLVALSSTTYNPQREDYINDYQEFKRLAISSRTISVRSRTLATKTAYGLRDAALAVTGQK
ncbi:MAG: FdtA/QdtA family cupin domain-containing protein [Candidatus Kerfeldbacteria bacterium]|nr:FdtA/QdtA family cupin domain-containing protein [Candidatus Kerfeldbacteria bacterium]